MTNQLQKEVNTLIEDCLNVNSSWVEAFNELAILYTLGLDLDLDGTIIGDYIIEDMAEKGYEVEGRNLEGLIYRYLTDFNYRLPTEWFEIEYNLEMAKEVALNNGADEDCIDQLLCANV